MKEQVYTNTQPVKICGIDFGVFDHVDMAKLSHVRLVNSQLFSPSDRSPLKFGVLDRKMGVCDRTIDCETCGANLRDCPGHFGHVELELPVYHIGYASFIFKILQCICKVCSRVLLPQDQKMQHIRRFRDKNIDMLLKKEFFKKLLALCLKVTTCPYCNSPNGKVKRVSPWKFVHEKHTQKGEKGALLLLESGQSVSDLKTLLGRTPELINPLRCRELFQNISNDDYELLLLDAKRCSPEMFLLNYISVPPLCIRPSIPSALGGSNEDDLTITMREIIDINSRLKQMIARGHNLAAIMQEWDHLQYTTAIYFMGEISGLSRTQPNQKPIRALSTRLKGKTGRFRGNLLGKRAEFTARTVISPDPNIRIDEVAVPVKVAKVLSFPMRVTAHNMEELKQMIINGQDIHPGANRVLSKHKDRSYYLATSRLQRMKIADALECGMVVERHVVDGDVVLFNRQPSLHRLSIMAHFARVMPGKTFRFNECVCGPYNADFDGDEMNLHVPQTEEARAEALTLMATKHNLITPRNGEPVIAAIQDFITASYFLSRKDVFFDRSQFTQLCFYFSGGDYTIDLPPPTILKVYDSTPPCDSHLIPLLKPIVLWTGKQIFDCWLKPNKNCHVLVNLKAQGRTKSGQKQGSRRFMCPRDSFAIIRNSELLCGVMDKTLVGGSKSSVFHILLRDYGVDVCADRMSRLARLCSRFLGSRGFSIGVSDVIPGKRLFAFKENLVRRGYEKCNRYIKDYQEKKLNLQPGLNELESLEAKLNGTLSAIRKDAGDVCLTELPRYNAPMLMALCGSKGSDINISQMIACVGQQTVNGTRIPNGFEDRSLPHFHRHSKAPAAKGFVENSFFSGLTPTEFFFHTMGGREGLVDTAVKTAETGYMQRRLTKALEDLCVMYDNSVRNSLGEVVQFKYGDDGLDPANMEGKDQPCDFQRVYMHAKYKTRRKDNISRGLSSSELTALMNQYINSPLLESCNPLFKNNMRAFLHRKIQKIHALTEQAMKMHNSKQQRTRLRLIEQTKRITGPHLAEFFKICAQKYERSKMEPGTAVGALAAQSIGEPGTQMTLKTFHFAGVASMNITLGVPRIKEIINATRNIHTPIITAELVNGESVGFARAVKGKIEVTFLKDVSQYIQEVIHCDVCYITIKLDMARIELLKLEVTVNTVMDSLLSSSSKLKLSAQVDVQPSQNDLIKVYVPTSESNLLYRLQSLKRRLPHVVIAGIPSISRAVINDRGSASSALPRYNLLAEGVGLRRVMTTRGVNGLQTETNHIMEMVDVMGIECARATIIDQIQYTMSEHGMQIDTRHTMLLADLMTCKGKVLGITRFGIGKMKDSVLMLASFERTSDVLFDCARHGMTDPLNGVSECIILGMPMNIGTGLFKLLKEYEKPVFPSRPLLFDVPSLHLPH
ncbi:DNA-directed RNA polymerase III subunit rpc1-like isoform X3 [Zophobas morio]|uniref:DNA-directed RNA polymerase III subunit rpc1-like isoform X3 n=1 Tax=Zophobas morio TaxID=2755281 RepID=UPI0030828C1D